MNQRSGIKAVIFDIGGVTIEWSDSVVYRYLEKTTGISAKKFELASEYYMKRFDEGKLTEHEFWDLIERKVGCAKKLDASWLEHYGKHAKRKKDAIRLVKSAKQKGYTVAALTNVIRPHYLYNRKSGLYGIFDAVFASCVIGRRKPDKRIYTYAAKKLGLKPNECIFMDDMPENVAGARKAGMKSFVFKNVRQARKELLRFGVKL
jgi:putative hydrolase of the HAD superfamily